MDLIRMIERAAHRVLDLVELLLTRDDNAPA